MEIFHPAKNHLDGNGCMSCRKMTTKEFIQKSKKMHGEKYDYSLVDYFSIKEKVTIICKKHGEFLQVPSGHLSGKGCTKCSYESKQSTTEEFIRKSKKIHGEKYDYSLVDYFSSNKKVKIICQEHGIFEQIPRTHLQNHACRSCSESRGEKEISIILNKINIDHVREKTFEDLKNNRGSKYRFDFYLPNFNCCIEYDGIQHFNAPKQWGGEKYSKISMMNDEIKNQYCLKKNIDLLRIKYNENIEEKLTQFLDRVRKPSR